MKDTRFFSLFLLLALVSPILFYHCNYFDFASSVHKVTSFLQLFGHEHDSGLPIKANGQDTSADGSGDANKAAYRPESVVKCCNLQKDKDVVVDSKQLRANQNQNQNQNQNLYPNPNASPQRRLNCVNKKEKDKEIQDKDERAQKTQDGQYDDSPATATATTTATDYHLDKTRNRPIVSENDDGRVGLASTYNRLMADIPSSFPAILDDGGENPRQTAEVVSRKRKKRKRGRGGRGNRRKHHRQRNRNQRRSPRRRHIQQDDPVVPRRDTDVQLVLDDVPDEMDVDVETDAEAEAEAEADADADADVDMDMEMDLDADADVNVEEASRDEGTVVDDGFDDMEVGEVLLQLGRAIKKTAVVMSNHAVQYPKDVCVVIVFVLLLIKLATWLSGGYWQARRNLVPLATSVPLLSTSASRGTSFSEGGLKPTLQTSFTCIPQTIESIRHLLPAESQPVIPRGMLKTGFGYQTASDTCNLRGIPDTFTILKNMPADIDVADIYLDTFRRMALQAGKMKTANLLKESQLFLEYRRNSYLKNNLPQNRQNDSSSRVIPTDSVLANISTDSQN